jgi:hypothetical protein
MSAIKKIKYSKADVELGHLLGSFSGENTDIKKPHERFPRTTEENRSSSEANVLQEFGRTTPDINYENLRKKISSAQQ